MSTVVVDKGTTATTDRAVIPWGEEEPFPPMPVRSRTASLLATAALVSLTSLTGIAHGSWPMARHDPHRTGAAPGTSDLQKPTPYFKTYLGGSLGQGQMLVADLAKTGAMNVVYVTGGRVVVKDVFDKVVWQTPPLGIAALVAVDDLDGDGTLDLVTYTGQGALVLAAPTGAIEWQEPAGDIGALGGLRLADMDGDGKRAH